MKTLKLALALRRAACGHVGFWHCLRVARYFMQYCKENGLTS